MNKILLIMLVLLSLPIAANSAGFVQGFGISDTDDGSSITMELSAHPEYKVFTLDNPHRIVLDIKDFTWNDSITPHKETQRVKGVRYSISPNRGLRVVFDLQSAMDIKKDFVTPPSGKGKYLLTIEFDDKKGAKPEKIIPTEIPEPVLKDSQEAEEVAENSLKQIPVPVFKERKKPLIVIDAGHGGHDPGTIGYHGVQEKDITLLYSRILRDELIATGKYNVTMTRDSDMFIKLEDRVKIARLSGGDLFISIHANSHPNPETEGLSVYTLSETASDKEAEALAAKENKSDIINGIDLHNDENELAGIIIDMTQRDTKNLSASLAETIVESASNEVKLLRSPHRFAGFRVLTGVDIPAVLIELGYLTNRDEEKLLISEKHKKKLAKAFVEAIDIHFTNYQID